MGRRRDVPAVAVLDLMRSMRRTLSAYRPFPLAGVHEILSKRNLVQVRFPRPEIGAVHFPYVPKSDGCEFPSACCQIRLLSVRPVVSLNCCSSGPTLFRPAIRV
jgi:hypothetical protein